MASFFNDYFFMQNRNADNKAMTYGKLRADQALLQTDFNAIEKVLFCFYIQDRVLSGHTGVRQ